MESGDEVGGVSYSLRAMSSSELRDLIGRMRRVGLFDALKRVGFS